MKSLASWALVVCTLLASSAFTVHAEDIFALTNNGDLLRFDSETPGTVVSVAVSGLQASETLLGIDFRPNTGQLYGVGSTSQVYSINATTGVATAVGTPFTPVLTSIKIAIDFNPTVDRLRLVGDSGQNLRLNPNTGATAATDTAITYNAFDPSASLLAPKIGGTAYTNNNQYATSTTLYAIDYNNDTLVTIGSLNSTVSPNGGVLSTVGSLGLDASADVGFDISGATGIAYASLTVGTTSTLYTINLFTGSATAVGVIGGGAVIADIAVVPPPITFDVVALRTDNSLIHFDLRAPGVVSAAVPISGLTSGTMQEIAYRTVDGVLWGVASTGQLYTINALSGVSTAVGTGLSPVPANFNLGFNFNPVADRIRLVNSANENFRANPNTGATAATDPAPVYVDANSATTPQIVAVGYTNHTTPPTTTTLFGIDQNLNVLVQIDPDPAQSNLIHLVTSKGALGVDVGLVTGFDITSANVAVMASGTSFYTVNLTSGAATLLSSSVGSVAIRSVAAVSPATASTLQFSQATVSVTEGGAATLTVSRSGSSVGSASVDYTVSGGSAVAGTNYKAVSGTLTFLSGEASRTIVVSTLSDSALTGILTANVVLSNPVGANLGAQSTATVSITDANDLDGDGFTNAVETAFGKLPNDNASVPYANAISKTLGVDKVGIKLNFAKPVAGDSVSFSGTLNLGVGTVLQTGTKVLVQAGAVNGSAGVVQIFNLGSTGKFEKGFALGKPAADGTAKYSVTLSKGTFASLLAGAGLTNTTQTKALKTLSFAVYIDGNFSTYTASKMNIAYTSSTGKSGSAVTTKFVP